MRKDSNFLVPDCVSECVQARTLACICVCLYVSAYVHVRVCEGDAGVCLPTCLSVPPGCEEGTLSGPPESGDCGKALCGCDNAVPCGATTLLPATSALERALVCVCVCVCGCVY